MERQGRNDQLDGLRGYAALSVVFWHAMLSADPINNARIKSTPLSKLSDVSDIGAKLALSIINGETAVILFFVLSGAVLINSLKREQGSVAEIAFRFVARRVFRIYPVLIFAIGLTASVFAIWSHVTARSILENLVLYDWKVVGPSWTLNVEFFAIFLVLPAFFAYRRFGEIGMIMAILLIGVVINNDPFKTSLLTAKPYIYAFGAGMLIPTRVGAFFSARIPWWLWPIALVVIMFARNTVPIGLRTFLQIEAIAAAVVVGLLYYGRAGVFGQWLERPSSVFLGQISYSLYLLNVPFLLPLDSMAPLPAPILSGLCYGALIAAVVMPLSYLSFRLIEKPGIALGRALTTRKAVPMHGQRNEALP